MEYLNLNLFREIVVDNFAGGGGASTGIELATGLSVDIAINHDPAAIAMHAANHPDTEHYCESVWDVDPKQAVKGRKVGLAWFSPDCTHHSKAKGGKPVKQSIRGLAWIAVRWAIAVKPRVIMLENVEEFKDWGPVSEEGKLIKEQKGRTFQSFVKTLESLGYEVQFRELAACDFGAPTIRKRFFMVARCDGKEIVWPKPTHADPKSLLVKTGKLKPWRTSYEIIDWSIGVPSIFSRKRPLVENTMKRIKRGIDKFIVNNPNPVMMPDIKADGNRFGLVTVAFLTKYYGQGVGQSLYMPLHTITTKDRFALTTVCINGHRVADIGLRMLQPNELFAGQGFPPGYTFNIGNKSDQIRRVGNSVPPQFAEQLVRANLPELCVPEHMNKYYSKAN
ncbi:DNA cytosine methyltransferase [Bacillus pumilus]|uniref:DNA cytosine methyltransferase n=1 Tax=Bacillus pumilus TaxID=1408 RepID=UPI003D7473F4